MTIEDFGGTRAADLEGPDGELSAHTQTSRTYTARAWPRPLLIALQRDE